MENSASTKNEDIVIKSFDEYIESINLVDVMTKIGDKTLLFRGQENSDWDLVPGLARPPYFRPEIEKYEKTILVEFKRRAIPFLPKTFNVSSDWEWLALAQHHKLPTRLLDWTENPLVALYFAFEFSKTKNNDRVVWIFGAQEDEFADSNNTKLSPFSLQKTKIYSPNQITQRITAQSGWFTVHKYLSDKDKFIAFNKNVTYSQRVFKMIFPNELRDQILFRLDRLGINPFSIYTDLDGLSKYLAWKYFK